MGSQGYTERPMSIVEVKVDSTTKAAGGVPASLAAAARSMATAPPKERPQTTICPGA